LIIALIVATFIDIDLRIIPDAVTLPAMAFGLLANWALGQVYIAALWYQTPAMAAQAGLGLGLVQMLVPAALIPGWLVAWPAFRGVPLWMTAHPHLHGLLVSLAGIVVGGGSIWAVRLVGRWALKREAMGFGDVVLMAMIGSFIGWQGTLIVFVLSLVCAVLVAVPQWLIWRDHELPYGPYLSVGTLLLLVSASKVWPWFDTRSDGALHGAVAGGNVVCLAGRPEDAGPRAGGRGGHRIRGRMASGRPASVPGGRVPRRPAGAVAEVRMAGTAGRSRAGAGAGVAGRGVLSINTSMPVG
jgi:prepilin signal peptidase PulO-like enzyme (type II secretory pathway)